MKHKVLKDYVDPLTKILLVSGATVEVDIDNLPPGKAGYYEVLLRNKFIEEVNDEPWKPKEDEEYWLIYSDGCVSFSSWQEHDISDQNRLDIGNCFQTKEQAEKALEWLKAFKVLRDDTKGFKPDWRNKEQPKWQVYLDMFCDDGRKLGELLWEDERYYHDSTIYFATEADANESIKNHEKEWRIFLGVEE